MGIKRKRGELSSDEARLNTTRKKRKHESQWKSHLESIPEEETESLAISIPNGPQIVEEHDNVEENFETDMFYYKEMRTCKFFMFQDVMKSLYLRLLCHLNDLVDKKKIKLSSKELNAINVSKGWSLLQFHLKLKIVIIAYIEELKIKGYPTTENMNDVIQEEIVRYYNKGLVSPVQSLFCQVFQKQRTHKHKKIRRERKIKESNERLLDAVENHLNPKWIKKMLEALKDIRQRAKMGRVPKGFEDCQTTILAQIFWLEYGLKKEKSRRYETCCL